METTYINESEVRDNIVKECRAMNQRLIQALNKKEKENGIGVYVGGLELPICHESMDLNTNIRNILAVLQCNYSNSMFYQLDNIRKMETLDLVQDFLRYMGLEEKFRVYKQMRQDKYRDSQSQNTILNLDAPVKAIPIP